MNDVTNFKFKKVIFDEFADRLIQKRIDLLEYAACSLKMLFVIKEPKKAGDEEIKLPR